MKFELKFNKKHLIKIYSILIYANLFLSWRESLNE